jgi:hypothetical protein
MSSSFGFEEYKKIYGPRRYVVVNADRRSRGEIIAALRRREINGIRVGKMPNIELDTIDYYYDMPQIEEIHIHDSDQIDLASLKRFPSLKVVGFQEYRYPIDLSKLGGLMGVHCGDCSEIIFPKTPIPSIDLFSIYGSPMPELSLRIGATFPNLRFLILCRTKLISLEGIDKNRNLIFLDLSLNKKLENIKAIASLIRLEELSIDSCRKCGSMISVVQSLPALRTLKFIGGGQIATLNWLKDMKCLETLVIAGTEVADNDLNPTKGLRRLVFNRKKSYFPSDQELSLTIDEVVRAG